VNGARRDKQLISRDGVMNRAFDFKLHPAFQHDDQFIGGMHEILPAPSQRVHPRIAGEAASVPVSPDPFNIQRISSLSFFSCGVSSRISCGVPSFYRFHENRSSGNLARICSMNENPENGTACMRLPSDVKMPDWPRRAPSNRQSAKEQD